MRKWRKKSVESRVMRWYSMVLLGVAAVILVIAGTAAYNGVPETVMQEKRVDSADLYSFRFLSQDSGTDKDEVYYTDEFFDGSNEVYDHELARASLALSMSAFDQKYAAELLEVTGYTSPVFYRYDQQNDEDKAALVIAHKNYGGRPVIVIAVRGGKYGDEWGSNGRVGYEGEAFGYHYGFHMAAKDAVIQLKEYAADNDLNLNESAVWITGFSRGAAVANVMGAMLLGQSEGVSVSGSEVTISPENLFDYTFASPSTVSDSLVTETPVKGVYNIVNPLDIVTRLPMNVSGISKTSKGRTVRYDWDYTKYGTIMTLPTESASAQLQVVQLLENALAFATRNESRYVEKTQDQVIIPALKKTMGKGADVSKRNVGFVLVDSLPGVASFLKNEVEHLDFKAQLYVAGILSGKKSVRLEKEHWPETYWGWMMKVDGL